MSWFLWLLKWLLRCSEALKEEEKKKSVTIFLERTREGPGHRQSDEHWNRFKGNVGEISERLTGCSA